MFFQAAGFFALLIPWLAIVVWMWRREWRTVPVSSRRFWPQQRGQSSPDHSRSLPPVWVLLALASLLLMVIALSQPVLLSRRAQLSVVEDRHVSMSARLNGASVAEALSNRLRQDLASSKGSVQLKIVAIGSDEEPLSLDAAIAPPRTARSTSSLVQAKCEALIRQGESVVVLSAQSLELPPSVVRYALAEAPENDSIESISASIEPSPQLMVKVRHRPQVGVVDLVVRGRSGSFTRRLELSPDQSSTTSCLELPENLGDWLEVRLLNDDSFADDNVAYLLRTGSWPRLGVNGTVPVGVERFAAVYGRQRPASDDAVPVTLTSDADETGLAILFAPVQDLAQPVTSNLDLPWSQIKGWGEVSISRIAAEGPPAGFEVLSKVGDRPILAIRENPLRQVWVGFGVDEFAQTPQWVEWMDELIGFLNRGGPPRWTHLSTDDVEASWNPVVASNDDVSASPGVYRSPSGPMTAANLPSVKWEVANQDPFPQLKSAIETSRRVRGFSLASWFALGAFSLAMAMGGLMVGPQRLDGKGGAS